MTEDKEYDFEELKKRTVEALNAGEYGSGLSIREYHYFVVASEGIDNERIELGRYPICLLEEYNKFVEDNLPNKELNQ